MIQILFISFPWLIALARTSSTMSSTRVRVGILGLFLILRRKAVNLLPLNLMLALDLSYMNFIMLACIPSVLCSEFLFEKILYFVKCFCCINWDDHMIFYLSFYIDVVYHFYWFMYVEPSLQSGDKSHLIMVYKSFNVVLNYSLPVFCWDFFRLYSSEILAYSFYLLLCPCMALYQVNSGLLKWVWEYSLFFDCFWGKVWEGLVLILLWLFGEIHLCNHLVLDFSLLGILITDSILACYWSVQIF